MLWIQSRVDYINNLPQILSKTVQQHQAQPSLQHPSKGLDSSKLEHHLVQQVGALGTHFKIPLGTENLLTLQNLIVWSLFMQ